MVCRARGKVISVNRVLREHKLTMCEVANSKTLSGSGLTPICRRVRAPVKSYDVNPSCSVQFLCSPAEPVPAQDTGSQSHWLTGLGVRVADYLSEAYHGRQCGILQHRKE